MASAEKQLTGALKRLEAIGIAFRRQPAKGSHVVDFVSDKGKLVIELDANQPTDERQARFTAQREAALKATGYRFLRVHGEDLRLRFAETVARIILFARGEEGGTPAAAPSPAPPPAPAPEPAGASSRKTRLAAFAERKSRDGTA